MAEPGKTEKATPKKKEEARKKGQVAKSQEVNSVVNIMAALAIMAVAGNFMMDGLRQIAADFWGRYLMSDVTFEFTTRILSDYTIKILLIMLPVLITVFIMGILANVLQVGFFVTFEPIKPKFDNINPVQGMKRMFSVRSLFELAKAIIKISVIAYIFYSSVKKIFGQIFTTPLMDIRTYFAFAADASMGLALKVMAAFAIFAIVDYLYQKWQYEDNLKMSKQEVNDEMKQMEGDPLIKSRIRQIQRELARSRMIAEIPKADVIITNPTHIAVAVRYEQDGERAPVIIAKGMNHMAEKIKEIARKNKVIIVGNPPLARALVKLEIGWEIPPELFQAVAEILAFVFQAKGKIRLDEKPKKVDNALNNGIIPDFGGNA